MEGHQVYHVTLTSRSTGKALASAHSHEISLGVCQGDWAKGFNAAETLLAALGACLITNIYALATKMRLSVGGVRVEMTGFHEEKPPRLGHADCVITLSSSSPMEKLGRLVELAFEHGTVANTLAAGMRLSRQIYVVPADQRPDKCADHCDEEGFSV